MEGSLEVVINEYLNDSFLFKLSSAREIANSICKRVWGHTLLHDTLRLAIL